MNSNTIQSIRQILTAHNAQSEHTESMHAYTLGANLYSLKIVLSDHGMSLEVILARKGDSKALLDYSIDTDLYDTADAKHQEFIEDIAKDILAVLVNLVDGKSYAGVIKGKVAMILRLHDDYVLVKGGLITKVEHVAHLNKALELGEFEALS